MDNIDTQPDFINLPKITIVPDLRHFGFDLGLSHHSGIETPTSYKIKQNPTPDISLPYIPQWFTDLEYQLLHEPIIKSLTHVWEENHSKTVFWNKKKDGHHIEPAQVFYTKTNKKIIIPAREILDDDYGKNRKRNIIIESIRDKFLNNAKEHKHSYERKGDYGYKSRYHKELFLEIIEALGLARKDEPVKKGEIETNSEYDYEYKYNRSSRVDTDLWYAKEDLNSFQKEEILD